MDAKISLEMSAQCPKAAQIPEKVAKHNFQKSGRCSSSSLPATLPLSIVWPAEAELSNERSLMQNGGLEMNL